MDRTIHTFIVAALMLTTGLSTVAGDLAGTQAPGQPVEHDGDPVIEEGLETKMAPQRGLIVHFEDRVPAAIEQASSSVIDVRYEFASIPAVYAIAGPAGLDTLVAREDIRFVEDAWKPIEYHLETATIASRAREVWQPDFDPGQIDEASPTLTTENGETIDGSGVGIAVVDTGIDATHPDLAVDGKLAGSYEVTPAGVVPAGDYTEKGSEHGTHMAGIAAGAGVVDADKRGGAPGASLYAFANRANPSSLAVGDTVLAPAVAMDWILANGEALTPSIEVVLNAWSCRDGACNTLNPDQAHIQLASDLAESGVTVVFPVGESGGEGYTNQVTAEAQIPTPGVLGVATYDDDDMGIRDSCTSFTSAPGEIADPTSWPDVSAPGLSVSSPNPITVDRNTRAPAGGGAFAPDQPRRTYDTVSGTSAAAAHAAGVAALLHQANPELDAAEVEFILEDTAEKLDGKSYCEPYVQADPSNTRTGANHEAGHGLVDAMDATEAALGFEGIPLMGPAEPVPEQQLEPGASVDDVQRTFYLDDGSLTEDRPGHGAPTTHSGQGDEYATFTSDPLEAPVTTSGILVDVWMGTNLETVVSLNAGEPVVTVERFPADGSPAQLVGSQELNLDHTYTPPNSPDPKHAVITTTEAADDEDTVMNPTTFETGDRIRVSVGLAKDAYPLDGFRTWTLYEGAHPTPSRIQLGQTTDDLTGGAHAWCAWETLCSRLGGDLQYNKLRCESDPFTIFHVRWTGPPGSSATASCNGALATCQIPPSLDAEVGTCTAESLIKDKISGIGQCTYTLPDTDTRGGNGHCAGLRAPS